MLPEPGQPSAQLSKLIRLMAFKQAKHTISLWYRTVFIPWLVDSYKCTKANIGWILIPKPQGPKPQGITCGWTFGWTLCWVIMATLEWIHANITLGVGHFVEWLWPHLNECMRTLLYDLDTLLSDYGHTWMNSCEHYFTTWTLCWVIMATLEWIHANITLRVGHFVEWLWPHLNEFMRTLLYEDTYYSNCS